MAAEPTIEQALEQALASLAGTPQAIATLTFGIGAPQLHQAPADREWSVNEVLEHLRSCSDVWGGCIQKIIDEDMPTIRAVSPRTWINRTDYREQGFERSLHAFTAQRAELLTLLRTLTREDWSRAATVTGAGRPFVHTVLSYAHRLSVHEREHLRQIQRTVSTLQGR